jgi:hypothetical protein
VGSFEKSGYDSSEKNCIRYQGHDFTVTGKFTYRTKHFPFVQCNLVFFPVTRNSYHVTRKGFVSLYQGKQNDTRENVHRSHGIITFYNVKSSWFQDLIPLEMGSDRPIGHVIMSDATEEEPDETLEEGYDPKADGQTTSSSDSEIQELSVRSSRNFEIHWTLGVTGRAH